jgi:uncharacterized membrane protein YkvA (DUF1232 family)
MIFGRRTEHKLPKFPENVESTFRDFCEALPNEAIPDVKQQLDQAVKTILRKSIENDLIETKLVNELYEASCALLERYEKFDKAGRAMVIGAIRYFVVEDDPLPDTGFSSGFYDDAKVMNYVIDQLGENELIIET